jgi:hypothetical protein
MLLPQKKTAVVLMSNCDWLGAARAQMANAALDVSLDLKPEHIAVPTEQWLPRCLFHSSGGLRISSNEV